MTTEERLQIGLDYMARTFQGWIDYELAQREKEGLRTTDSTAIITPDRWPTHGQLKHWVALLREVHEMIAANETPTKPVNDSATE